MSWRSNSSLQPARTKPQATSKTPRVNEALIFIAHLGHEFGADPFEELCGIGQIEFRVGSFDTEKETVVGGLLEARHREERAMRLRKFVQRQHSEHGKRR